jgi:hypothetical protein
MKGPAMNEKQIKIGRVYTAKVKNREVSLRVDEEHPDGGWGTTSLFSGRRVRIKTATRFGRPVTKTEIKSGTVPGMNIPTARGKRLVVTKPTPKPSRKASVKRKATNAKRSEARSYSGLEAAHKVLQESNPPLSAGEIVDFAAKNGYWKSKAATPQATIHAAMSREIKKKGKNSRFKKVGRGKFAANS